MATLRVQRAGTDTRDGLGGETTAADRDPLTTHAEQYSKICSIDNAIWDEPDGSASSPSPSASVLFAPLFQEI